MPHSQFKVGVNSFVMKDGKILLGKRKNVPGEGQWGLPGGHMETGEGFIEAAKRELLEETGLIAENIEFLQLVNGFQEPGHFIHINFLVTEWRGELKNMEPDKCEGWEWFDINSVPENIFFGHKDFIPAFKRNINFVN